MSDNEDLLGDDLGDHSLADYNLGNEEEDQLLADDYETSAPQNVPASVSSYNEAIEPSREYSEPQVTFTPPVQPQPPARKQYHLQPDKGECVVPNITIEVPNIPDRPSYAPYEPPTYPEQVLPPVMPAAPIESPQIVPSEMSSMEAGGRERFISERPVGAQRMPQQRDIPDSLDKVVVPMGNRGRGRTTWRNPHFHPRAQHHYRRPYGHRGNFNQRPPFPSPQKMRHSPPRLRPEMRPNPPQMRPELRPDLPPNIRPDLPPNIRSDLPPIRPDLQPNRPDLPPNRSDLPPNRPDLTPNRPDLPPNRPDLPPRPDLGPIRPGLPPNLRPDLPNLRPDLPPNLRPDLPPGHPDLPEIRPEPGIPGLPAPELPVRPDFPPPHLRDMPPEPYRPMERPFRFQNQFRPDEPRNFNPGMRPNFDPFYRPFRPFAPVRENAPMNPQVIRHPLPPGGIVPQQEVRMLPVQLPVPPSALAGKKVLINPHFKGNFQPPVEGLTLPAYIPTRIQKTPPPLSPTLENKFGPMKDIDDAAERFIAEQRNALARAATRKFPPRRSPQRYIENTTIEIENELARPPPPERRRSDDDLLRRQEEFINANRAGLRRRMRSPSPLPPRPRSPRSPSPRRARVDETTEYKRRMREQEALRERVMRAKEVRRRKNAVAAAAAAAAPAPPPAKPLDRDRERLDKDREREQKEKEPARLVVKPSSPARQDKPDTTRTSPEGDAVVRRQLSPSPAEAEVNSTCEGLTPPRTTSPAALTPPLPEKRETERQKEREDKRTDSDDDLDLILGDIDGILSDDEDTGRFKDKPSNTKPEPPKPSTVDLRTKLPPKPADKKPPRKPIVFEEKEREREDKRREKERDRSPVKKREEPKKTVVKTKEKVEISAKESKASIRQRITFDKKEQEKEKQSPPKEKAKDQKQFPTRRVVLQRKVTQNNEKSVFTRIEVKSDPSKPNPGIFSRAVRTAIGSEASRIVVKRNDDPEIEFESDSDLDEESLLGGTGGFVALVSNLPPGITDTRLKTLAGNDVQNIHLDKEDRSAKITFKSTTAADTFKKKFNNKMVAASRLTVTLK